LSKVQLKGFARRALVALTAFVREGDHLRLQLGTRSGMTGKQT